MTFKTESAINNRKALEKQMLFTKAEKMKKILIKQMLITVMCSISGIIPIVNAETVKNPVVWADIPDISIVLAGDKYYMSHTTMHMAPGVPIMESEDMVNWKTIGYCYSILTNNDMINLANGKNAYGKGSWASSIRYKDSTFYVMVPSQTSGNTHLYTTRNIKNGPWKETKFPLWHDPSLFFDDDGRNYVLYGQGNINIIELNSDLTGVKSGGLSKVLLNNPHTVASTDVNLPAEGTQIHKINGYYYIFTICWPRGGVRTALCHRSKSLTGPYEGKVVLSSNGVAQGSVIQMKDGSWMGYLFQDNGSVGRSPWLIPVSWSNDWPVFNNGKAPESFNMPSVSSSEGCGIVTSDEFADTSLKLEWQFNHNPDNSKWSLKERPGYLRIRTGRVDKFVTSARNSLTQRSFGPKCSGRISLDVKGLKNGDYAGLCALQNKYGFVGVRRSDNKNYIVMMNGSSGSPVQAESVNLTTDKVFLRIDMDFTNRTDKATFFYSLDSISWKSIGNTLQMSYDIPHFMGYRFALFNFATGDTGGVADFDWFHIGPSVSQRINLYPGEIVPVKHSHKSETNAGFKIIRNRSVLTINYRVPRTGNLSIALYDSRGSIIRRFSGYCNNAGYFSMDCQIPSIADGRYIMVARFEGKVVSTEPVILMK